MKKFIGQLIEDFGLKKVKHFRDQNKKVMASEPGSRQAKNAVAIKQDKRLTQNAVEIKQGERSTQSIAAIKQGERLGRSITSNEPANLQRQPANLQRQPANLQRQKGTSNNQLDRNKEVMNSGKSFLIYKVVISAIAGLLVATLITRSVIISMPYALMISGLPAYMERRKREKRKSELREVWPEILDHIISGLRSGLSLSETISALGKRGPEISKEIFINFENALLCGVEFDLALGDVKKNFSDPMADQVCEVLKFARGSGSRDTSVTLRTLSDFIRSDLDLRSEIAAKHGWIKNSAVLASIAPWILLLILVSQPNTLKAYSSPSGLTILFIGALLTVVAYIWMNLVGKIPENPRVFNL